MVFKVFEMFCWFFIWKILLMMWNFYGENILRGVFLYWKYDKFDLDNCDEVECKVEMIFVKFNFVYWYCFM